MPESRTSRSRGAARALTEACAVAGPTPVAERESGRGGAAAAAASRASRLNSGGLGAPGRDAPTAPIRYAT